jgi:hypothetical protein
MKRLLILIAIISSITAYGQQQKVVFEKMLPMKEGFTSTVTNGMYKYNKNPSKNSFWENNVMREPLYKGEDSIVYNIKFITNYGGMLLWGGIATFTPSNDSIKCRISDLLQIKKSSMVGGVSYINVRVDEMEGTRGDQLNLHRLRDEINHFFKRFR